MRIICPGCDAQYEVPDEVIPDEGRDVQCSNCGTTWMFGSSDDPGDVRPYSDEDDDEDEDEDDDGSGNEPVMAPPRRELDPKVAGILRAEAERESAARAADSRREPLEIQPDLGLTEGLEKPAPRAPGAAVGDVGDKPAKMSRDAAQAGNMTVAAAAAAGSRGDLLPDIEEINSTLRSTGDRDMAGSDPDPEAPGRLRRRRGFRRGVLVAVLIFVAGLLVYQYAPEIAEAVPQADPWLSSFVTWIDAMRTDVDATVRDVLSWLDAQATSGE